MANEMVEICGWAGRGRDVGGVGRGGSAPRSAAPGHDPDPDTIVAA